MTWTQFQNHFLTNIFLFPQAKSGKFESWITLVFPIFINSRCHLEVNSKPIKLIYSKVC